jgi:serpin B
MKYERITANRGVMVALGFGLFALLIAGGCGDDAGDGLRVGDAEARSDLEREAAPGVSEADAEQLAADNREFAASLYRAVRGEQGNLVMSPYSISLALAMTYAGARGVTEEEMAAVLRWQLAQDDLHPAFNALDTRLMSGVPEASPNGMAEDDEGETPRLNIANSIWGQRDFAFEGAFLETLARDYGAGLRLADFQRNPDEARRAINAWVSEQTEDRINDLIPPGAIDELTRLALVNAIYFKASWLEPFDPDQTKDGQFNLSDGADLTVPMMHTMVRTGYTEAYGVQAVSLPYLGFGTEFLLLVPESGDLGAFEESLDGAKIDAIVNGLSDHIVTLTMPKFKFESQVDLKRALESLGMASAFDPARAEFSGIADVSPENLYLTDAFHKALISVDEAGTEAAASTAILIGVTSAPPPAEVTADRPFLFMIRDVATDTILFIGRVADPSNSD